jgi:hypothetical protein
MNGRRDAAYAAAAAAKMAGDDQLWKYDALRRPVDRDAVARVRFLSQIVRAESLPERVARKWLLPITFRIPPLRRRTLKIVTGQDHPLRESLDRDAADALTRGADKQELVLTSSGGASAIGATAVGAAATRVRAVGSLALGALAIGDLTLGAVAIGCLVIRRLVVRDAHVHRLVIDELMVKRFVGDSTSPRADSVLLAGENNRG